MNDPAFIIDQLQSNYNLALAGLSYHEGKITDWQEQVEHARHMLTLEQVRQKAKESAE